MSISELCALFAVFHLGKAAGWVVCHAVHRNQCMREYLYTVEVR